MLEKLRNIERNLRLNPIHKIILTTDGSVTRILESLFGKRVDIITKDQKIIKANKYIADVLGINVGENVNLRSVFLVHGNVKLAYAVSFSPIERLDRRFRDDIARADIPIGRIMAKHKIEARREIIDISVVRSKGLSKILSSRIILKRNYNIISNKRVLINITEFFPYELYNRLY